ncbi:MULTISPECIES: hypothetical protein [Mammaliicoccus]|uniref:hypothetical protein n=1 Tax=Mammaliicoccus TaxID=2803850 RepID=UPI001EFAB670|nr:MULTISPECIES: hypothetical protein [Mammaliicoccus]MEB7779286.1 hypothetical protein [Mammaliicoccus fleurettii]MEB8067712.1 hypothetical protein [Mammaliicoccus fleurettii]
MEDKRFLDFYIDWYCMFYDLYDYDVGFGAQLYGEFRKELSPYFRFIRKHGEHTSFFGANRDRAEARVGEIKNNKNHCLYDLYYTLKSKELSDILFDPKEKWIELKNDQFTYGNSVLYELVNDYYNRAPYFPYNELLFVPVVDAESKIIEAFRKVFAGIDVKIYLVIDEKTNKTYHLHITLDKEEGSYQKMKAYEKEHNVIL